jgi:uncharacterized membrane protein
MTRDDFLKRLERGLAGMPAATIAEITGDYADHFAAASADGRSEAEVAEALGDPGRLARELKLEAGIKRWEEGRSPSAAWSAVIAFLGLGAIDILILLPILASVIGVIFGLYVAMLAIFIAGGAIMIAGPFSGFPGGPLAALLSGLGIMAAATAITALLTIVTIWLINALMWFARLHYKVIQPAIEPDANRPDANRPDANRSAPQ